MKKLLLIVLMGGSSGLYGSQEDLWGSENFESELSPKDSAVAKCLWDCYDGRIGIEQATQVYNAHPVCADDCFRKNVSLGSRLDSRDSDDDIDRDVEERWNKLRDLVREKRFDQREFTRLVGACLLGKSKMQDLENFARGHQAHMMLQVGMEGKSLRDYLEGLNPRIYKMRDKILKIIAPHRELPADQMAGRSVQQVEEYDKHEVISMIENYLFLEGALPKFEWLEYAYRQVPVSVDEYRFEKGRDDVTLGQEIDRRFEKEYAKKLNTLVQKERWLKPENDSDCVGFGKLTLAFLVKPDQNVQRRLAFYLIGLCKIYPGSLGVNIKTLPMGFSCGEKKDLNVQSFFERLNPRLFPHKYVVYKFLAMHEFIDTGKEHSAKTDKQFIEDLLRSSLIHRGLRPLVKYAYSNYKKVYSKEAGTIDIFKVSYQEGSVGSYLHKKGRHAECTEYLKIFGAHAPKKQKVHIPEAKKPKKSEVMVFWKKCLMAGAAGVISYGFYKLYASKGEEAGIRAAHMEGTRSFP